ncbi:Uncharacterised protein [Vibrio cholerae]|nr:Uncharacterised protein [Vibrio cholerae]CSI50372.1 Uncharacterised protein [Vibrio cholerae]
MALNRAQRASVNGFGTRLLAFVIPINEPQNQCVGQPTCKSNLK